ncbi:MAG: ferritin family protein [Candidatus Omnitrophota bacterium]
MANIFSPQEILRIAIKVEENGKKLYEALEKKTSDNNAREVWAYLKDQEELHRKTFQNMLDNIGDYIVYEFSPGEYEAYIRAIAGGYVFTEELMEKKAKEGFKSDLEAIDFGIYVEKESILTYSALREYVLVEKQLVLDKVIDEEKNHLVKLTILKDKVKK